MGRNPARASAVGHGLFEEYFEDLRRTGIEIVECGTISDATRADLERDLLPGDLGEKHRMANDHWRRLRERAGVA